MSNRKISYERNFGNRRSLRTGNVVKKRGLSTSTKIIFVLLVILFIMAILIAIVNKYDKGSNNKGTIYNNNESFVKNKKIDGIVFKNIECSYDGKDSLITYVIENDTDKKIYLKNYDVIIKDKKKNVLTKIVAQSELELDPKEKEKMANGVVGIDLTDAYYMELELKIGEK